MSDLGKWLAGTIALLVLLPLAPCRADEAAGAVDRLQQRLDAALLEVGRATAQVLLDEDNLKARRRVAAARNEARALLADAQAPATGAVLGKKGRKVGKKAAAFVAKLDAVDGKLRNERTDERKLVKAFQKAFTAGQRVKKALLKVPTEGSSLVVMEMKTGKRAGVRTPQTRVCFRAFSVDDAGAACNSLSGSVSMYGPTSGDDVITGDGGWSGSDYCVTAGADIGVADVTVTGCGHTARGVLVNSGSGQERRHVTTLVDDVAFFPRMLTHWGPEYRSGLAAAGDWAIYSDGTAFPVKKVHTEGGDPMPLAAQVVSPQRVIVSGDDLVWTDHANSRSRRLWRWSRDGSETVLLAEDSELLLAATNALASDGMNAYWFDAAPPLACPSCMELRSVPLAGGEATTLAQLSNGSIVSGLTTDGEHVYFWEHYPPYNWIRRVPVEGGEPEVLTDGLGWLAGGLALVDGWIYFGNRLFEGDQILRMPASGGIPTLVVQPEGELAALAADGDRVYWIEGTTLRSAPVLGGSTTILADGIVGPRELRIDEERAYWTEGGARRIRSVPLRGGSVETLVEGIDGPYDLAVGSEEVYWISTAPHLIHSFFTGAGRIAAAAKAGGDPVTVVNGVATPLAELTTDGTTVFIADGSVLKEVPLAGGPLRTLGGSTGIEDLDTDGTSVYWVTYGSHTTPGSVEAIGVDGSDRRRLARGDDRSRAMASNSTHVFWIDGSDTIRRVPISGGEPETLAESSSELTDLEVDETHVYFSTLNGSVRRLPVEGGADEYVASARFLSWTVLALDDDHLYTIGPSNVKRVPKTGNGGRTFFAGFIESMEAYPSGIAVSESGVYWTELAGGTVKKAAP